MHRRRAALLALLALGAGLLTAAPRSGGAGEEATPWRAAAQGPLGPRETAVGFWTGSEVVVAGGSDAPPCPPSASCLAPRVPPLADGAAYDPRTDTWRRIADAPVAFDWAEAVVIGPTAYLAVPGFPGRPGSPRAFLAYRIGADEWEELPVPTDEADWWYTLVAAGDRPVLVSGSDEAGERPDLVLDLDTGSWRVLSEAEAEAALAEADRAGEQGGIPPLDEAVRSGPTVVQTGDGLFAFGGARWDGLLDGELLADAWTWSPRDAAGR